MATAVLDVELDNLPEKIDGLNGYEKAFILFRYKGTPVCKKVQWIKNGCIDFKDKPDNVVDKVIQTQLTVCKFNDYLDYDERNVIEPKTHRATIAICTRNRTTDLKRCLDAVVSLPDEGQEIIVIDNCPSTNDTAELVRSYPQVRYILENRPGLDIARNRALFEAKGEVVAFTDDDAVPDKNWLRALLFNFNNPLTYCVTGLTMPLELETKAQEAFESYSPFGKGFKRKVFNSTRHNPLLTGQIGAGANMALRKSVLKDVGIFDEALDAGTPTHSGGDHEMFARILLSGFTIVYEPNALSWHRHRKTWKELTTTIYGYGVGVYSLFTRHLLMNFELQVIKIAFNWFWSDQLPALVKALLKRPHSVPRTLILAELKGCIVGPFAYLNSRRKSNIKS